jgi:hypothetical protein
MFDLEGMTLGGGEVAQTMYTHVSKCKNDKIKKGRHDPNINSARSTRRVPARCSRKDKVIFKCDREYYGYFAYRCLYL